MADLDRLLHKATSALIAGDRTAALRILAEVEQEAIRRPELVDARFEAGLARFSELARAAGEGIADAREQIARASGNARRVNTYDGTGKANPVEISRPALGRF